MPKITSLPRLDAEIKAARKTIVTDGYDMSVGEVMNLYRDFELKIDPVFQRLFRWDDIRKSRFIESLLLGIPIPPIFVYQNKEGVWELIDGLQRLSTILEFAGQLRASDDREGDQGTVTYWEPSQLVGTKLLPSLEGKQWRLTAKENSIGKLNQIAIKRARIRVEILKAESDPNAKFELFTRLNTGGEPLSEQEVRNCVAVMLNKELYSWLVERSTFDPFRITAAQTQTAVERQTGVELVLRFVAFRHVKYDGRMDIHEYLDNALLELADADIDWDKERKHFERVFSRLADAMGEKAFKRWDGSDFKGKFLMSLFETVGFGTSQNIDQIEKKADPNKFIRGRAKEIWSDDTFIKNSGAGVRGTTRLSKLLDLAKDFFHRDKD